MFCFKIEYVPVYQLKITLTASHETLGLLGWFLPIFTCYHTKVEDNWPERLENFDAHFFATFPVRGIP